MDRIEDFDPVSGVVAVEAGVILEKLNAFLAPHGCEAPLDLGAKGSCMLGGNAATHAGGKYVLRNGPLRAHVRGL
jgi:FAD/FMN-containing dehydrogenase